VRGLNPQTDRMSLERVSTSTNHQEIETMEVKQEIDDPETSDEERNQLVHNARSRRGSRLSNKAPGVRTFLIVVIVLALAVFLAHTLVQLDTKCSLAVEHANVALQSLTSSSAGSTVPLIRGHSHNDYEQEKPLASALAAGMCSIEVDVFLEDGKLLVGHTEASDQTMQKLYLEPLRRRIDANGGSVYARAKPLGLCTQVQLVVDLKTPDANTWDAVELTLTQELGPTKGGYLSCDLETAEGRGALSPLRVVVSGVSAEAITNFAMHMSEKANRCSSLDGRRGVNRSPAVTRAVSAVQTMMSEDLAAFTGLNGQVDETKLTEFARHAHEAGVVARMWGVATSTELWQLLMDAGIDVISVDDLLLFRHFMLG
jgi:glycerophosphoryl diester phosphodiesterase